jgi:hypothetical protein
MLVLPEFDTRHRQPKVPHVARVVASRPVDNEHGVAILYEVRQGRSGKEWWISASLDGLRMSDTLRTGVKSTADAWIDAVQSGRVRVGQRGSPERATVPAGKISASQIRRDISEELARRGGSRSTRRGGSELRELEDRRQSLFRQLGYAGNTAEMVHDLHRELGLIGARISVLRGR